MNHEEFLKTNVSIINEIPNEARNVILKIALAQANSSTQNKSKILDKFANEYNIRKSLLVEIIAAYIAIIKLFLANNNEEFNEILNRVGFSASFIEELPLVQLREEVTNTIIQCKRKDNRNLVSMKWRIDISLYNKLQNLKAKYVIIQINLKDGKRYTIEMDIKTFNKLRYNVALIMRELNSINKSLQ